MPQLSSPLLDQYNQDGIVTPALQRALDAVKQKLPQFGLQSSAPDTPTRTLQPPGAGGVPPITRTPAAPAPGLVSPGGPAPSPTMPAPGAPAMPSITDQSHLAERNRLIESGPGSNQIKNPVARGLIKGLSAVGDSIFPQITMNVPGTGMHHELLVRQANRTVEQDTARAKDKASTANLQAEATKNLQGHIPTNELELWAQQNPGKPVEEFLKTKRDNAPERNETAFDAWRKQNPDAPVEDWLKANSNQQENTHVLPDGSVIAVHNDPKTGKSTAEVLYQGKPQEKPGHVIQRTVNGKIHNILVDAETGQDRQDLGEGRQPTPPDHGQNYEDPNTHTMVRIEPGGKIPTGAVTPQQGGSANVKAAAATTAEAKAAEDAKKEYSLVQQFAAKPSPTNDLALLMHYIGATKPDSIGKLRLNTNEIALATGTRNSFGDLQALEQKVINGQSLTAKQRQDMMETMRILAESKGAGGEQKVPDVKSKADYDALPSGATYMEDGRKFKKP